jgi:hypothetical protein
MPQPGIGDVSEAEDEQSLSRPKARVVFRASSDDAPLGQAARDHLCGSGSSSSRVCSLLDHQQKSILVFVDEQRQGGEARTCLGGCWM